MEYLCKFAVLRYVPDEIRKEFINIGLVFHCPERNFLDLKLTTNFSRVTAFDDEVDINFLKLVLDGIKTDFALTSTVDGPSLQEIGDWNLLEQATAIYVNQLQFSSVQIIRSNNIEEDFKNLFRTHVYFDTHKSKRITEREVKGIMNRVLKEKDVFIKLNRNKAIDIGPETIELDYAYSVSDKTKIIKTFSFDYTPKGSSQAPLIAKEWAWNFSKLKKVNIEHYLDTDNTDIEIVTFVYVGDKENKNVSKALKILKEESSTIAAYDEKAIEDFADDITKDLN